MNLSKHSRNILGMQIADAVTVIKRADLGIIFGPHFLLSSISNEVQHLDGVHSNPVLESLRKILSYKIIVNLSKSNSS